MPDGDDLCKPVSRHLEPTRVEVVSHSPEETRRIGEALGANAREGQVYLLQGELGAGKTCLTQGVLWGLGAREYARSPTFVLVAEYEARLPLYHIDLFRVDAAEVLDLGLEEYLYGDGLCVIEWADKAPGQFPEPRLEIRMEYMGDTMRRLVLSSSGAEYAEALGAVKALICPDLQADE